MGLWFAILVGLGATELPASNDAAVRTIPHAGEQVAVTSRGGGGGGGGGSATSRGGGGGGGGGNDTASAA